MPRRPRRVDSIVTRAFDDVDPQPCRVFEHDPPHDPVEQRAVRARASSTANPRQQKMLDRVPSQSQTVRRDAQNFVGSLSHRPRMRDTPRQ